MFLGVLFKYVKNVYKKLKGKTISFRHTLTLIILNCFYSVCFNIASNYYCLTIKNCFNVAVATLCVFCQKSFGICFVLGKLLHIALDLASMKHLETGSVRRHNSVNLVNCLRFAKALCLCKTKTTYWLCVCAQ